MTSQNDSRPHRPEGDWVFDDAVVDVFPDMLERSIPNLKGLRRVTQEVILDAIGGKSYPRVLDIGASLCGASAALLSGHDTVTVTAVDNAEAMVKRLAQWAPDRTSVLLRDVEDEGLPEGPWDAVVLSLTLQFIAPAERLAILAQMHDTMPPGGVVFVAEKTLGPSPEADAFLVRTYHRRKMAAGYSAEAVEAKRVSLQRSLMPWSAIENERAFAAAGFKVCRVWQALSFCGWRLLRV